ncbi:MAG: hypothetical protein JXO72_03715 [Vicinamibacteria bacterium]|nr:hypothetical protein [Vicinamibacteria bacterium]
MRSGDGARGWAKGEVEDIVTEEALRREVGIARVASWLTRATLFRQTEGDV